MLQYIKNLPALDNRNDKEHFLLCDIGGLAEVADQTPKDAYRRVRGAASFYGGMSYDRSLNCVRSGDLTNVRLSDEYLGSMETLVPLSQGRQTVNDVVGALPNVPLMLSGCPYNMRRRVKRQAYSNPLSLFLELTSSAGVSAGIIAKRGAAILALVRLLSNIRPVELWAACAIGKPGVRASTLIRIDTTPLDLARAAHVLTHASVPRALCYEILERHLLDGDWVGQWGFDNHGRHIRTAAESYKRIIHPGSDCMFVPPVHLNDEYLTDPTQWLTKMLHQYGGVTV